MSALQQTFVVTTSIASTLKDHTGVDVTVVSMRQEMEDVEVATVVS